jgi:phosphoribosylglycinamide formyltransferase 1
MPIAKKLRVAILISGTGSNMKKLVEATKATGFPAKVVLVISNRADAGGLAWAREQGIPCLCIDHRGRNREEFDSELHAVLDEAQADLICLAGFMRILSGWFVSQWPDKVLNIHPSLLPAFTGLHTHKRALDSGVKMAGCTVHFVTKDLDDGPVIAQAALPILDNDTEDTLQARVQVLEHQIYPAALALVASGRYNPQPSMLKRPTFVRHPLSKLPLGRTRHELWIEPPPRQRMPRSLGLTLRTLRLMAGGKTQAKFMTEDLRDNIGRFFKNGRVKDFTGGMLSQLGNDRAAELDARSLPKLVGNSDKRHRSHCQHRRRSAGRTA